MLFRFAALSSRLTAVTTWNPADKGSNCSLSGGDLTATSTSYLNGSVRSTTSKSTGKWYFENTISNNGGGGMAGGAGTAAASLDYPGASATSWGYQGAGGNAGKFYNNGSSIASTGVSYAAGDVIGHALDADAGTLILSKNGTPVGTITGLSGAIFAMFGGANVATEVVTTNFGGSAFAFPPSGYSAWG